MGAQENIRIVQDLVQAVRDRDEARYGDLFAADAVIRMAGVPRAVGGVARGREQIVQNFRELGAPSEVQVRTIFADDTHVCAVERVSAPFTGNQYFRGTGKPFTTYQCMVFNIEGGRIREETVYTNFLDVYVQAGLVPLESLTARG